MKNRIYLHSAICIVIIFGLFACGGGKYAEAEKVMKKQADIGIAYVNALESANSAKDVAKAIDTYTDEMEELIPDINKMMKDLPEVLNQEAPPKELAEESAQVAKAGEKIQKALSIFRFHWVSLSFLCLWIQLIRATELPKLR